MINIRKTPNGLSITAPDTIKTTSMTGGLSETFYPYETKPFETRKLFSAGNLNIVLTDFYTHGVISYAPYKDKNIHLMDVVGCGSPFGE